MQYKLLRHGVCVSFFLIIAVLSYFYPEMRFTIFIFVLFLFAGCKKYPDGGHAITFKGLTNKIIGKWKILSFTVDGSDSLDFLKSDPDFCPDYQLEFSRDDIFGNTMQSPCSHFGNNYWGVTDDKAQLKLVFHPDSSAATLFPVQLNAYKTVTWDIERLVRHELWLKVNYANKEYELKLERKD